MAIVEPPSPARYLLGTFVMILGVVRVHSTGTVSGDMLPGGVTVPHVRRESDGRQALDWPFSLAVLPLPGGFPADLIN